MDFLDIKLVIKSTDDPHLILILPLQLVYFDISEVLNVVLNRAVSLSKNGLIFLFDRCNVPEKVLSPDFVYLLLAYLVEYTVRVISRTARQHT